MWSALLFVVGALAAHRDARVNHIPQNDVDELRHMGRHHITLSRRYNTTTSIDVKATAEYSKKPDQLTITSSRDHAPTVSVFDGTTRTIDSLNNEESASVRPDPIAVSGQTSRFAQAAATGQTSAESAKVTHMDHGDDSQENTSGSERLDDPDLVPEPNEDAKVGQAAQRLRKFRIGGDLLETSDEGGNFETSHDSEAIELTNNQFKQPQRVQELLKKNDRNHYKVRSRTTTSSKPTLATQPPRQQPVYNTPLAPPIPVEVDDSSSSNSDISDVGEDILEIPGAVFHDVFGGGENRRNNRLRN